ncbi:SusC/RagA family TonB-linked outer membrane protein [Mucilaginibacter arboris]|uniref:SusC/RagA family TonB-linked outer membrane protein n=1 Tax=Mucilaginibacter arboris TaxID=2682090 RepID=A0A7K1SSZ0_9SPHI|nr:SusC/RagA family TonB-linked outer membrane protein [Mucilaginibacter arboris]MVN20436.1 SusC/RagA family TonB-linked outer membrane protein [Mucilaginibacter arboris]
MNLKFTFFKTLLTVIGVMLYTVLHAQTGTVSGTVTAEKDKQTLPAVSVVVKGKPGGTQTGLDGTFKVKADKGDVLVFTSIGFVTKQVTVGSSTNIQVALAESSNTLNEVVVVGYGTQSRSTVTSAVAKLDNQVLATAPRANIGSALQGTISGVQVVNSSGSPGSSPLITLRGGASISSSTAPLVVVDGIIRSYNDIPSEDIASIDVLKDAAATAIYGARANNGVILITTKQGKSGVSQISYKFTEGYNKQRDNYHYLDAGDFIYYNRLGNINSGRTLAQINASRGYGLLTDAANAASFDIKAETPANIGLLQQGWQDIDDPANPGSKIIYKDHGQQIQNLLFRNSHTQDHYLSATGGNDKGRYFSSLDYYNEDGVIIGSNYNRYSGTLNGSYKVKPNIEVSSGATFSTSSQLGVVGSSEINTLYRNLALWPTFNPWLDAADTQPNPGNGVTDGNPLYWLNKLKRSNEVDRITANAAVKWDIRPDLYLRVSGSGYLYQTVNQSFQQATQTYTQIFAAVPSFSTSRESYNQYYRTFQQTYDAILNYTKDFGKHHITALLGAEYYDQTALTIQVDGTNAPTDAIPTANASTTFNVGANTSSQSENRIISSFTRVGYDYDRKYLFNFVLREDGVSQLAFQKRLGFFPGISAGWDVVRENFFENSGISKVVSTLKPRVSYGTNGNIAGLGNYDVQGVYSSQTLYNGLGTFLNTGLTNNNLVWEKSRTTDVGADIGFFKDRISLIFDYYNRITSDLLTNLSLPSYTGFSTLKTNLGTLQNRGVEFTLNGNIINNPKGFRLSAGVTASYVRNKVLKLPYNGNVNNRQGGLQVYDPKSGQVIYVGGLQEGQEPGQIYGYKQVSIFKDAADVAAVAGNRIDNVANITGPNLPAGKGGHITPGDVNWLDVDKNDTIDSRDQVYLGNINPRWQGGFNINVAYKALSLYTRFQYNTGNTIYNDLVARTLGNYQGTFNYIDLIKQAWSPTNTVTDIPKVYYADQVVGSKQNYTRGNNGTATLNGNNSNFYESGNYLACREITLSYDFPKNLLGKTKFLSGARIYVSGENLFYLKKFSGPTPEAPIDPSTGLINGIYQGTYPTPKSFVFGIQASF